MTMFGEQYSKYYDLTYSGKDYGGECDYLESIFSRYSHRKVERILDVACGTGGHALILTKRGYYVYASDVSSSMVEIAKKKATSLGLENRITFKQGDMRNISVQQKFDVCICMFGSIDYLLDYDDVLKAFGAIHRQLKSGGLLVFDFWNGLAVLTIRPSETIKFIDSGKTCVIKLAKPRLFDPLRNITSIDYITIVIEDGSVKDEFKETHTTRYFYPEEIRYLLRVNGFELLSYHPFLKLGSEVTVSDWSITAVAKRRD